MKKIFFIAIIFMQSTYSLAQSCEQRLKKAIDGMNNFKSCSQRAEMNQLLEVATSVVNECPVYYAEHQNEFLKAKKFTEDTYEKLGCTNTGNTNGQNNSILDSHVTSNSSANSSLGEQVNGLNVANKVTGFMQSITNKQESKETLDKMANFELAKLEIEPEFNEVSSPTDFNKVSFTTINYENLNKGGNVAVSMVTSALSNVEKAKEKAFKSAKIQAAFLGANTVVIKVLNIGSKTLGGPYNYPTTDLFGTAYSDKKINFDLFKQIVSINKKYKVEQFYSHSVNSMDFKSENINKPLSISEINYQGNKIKLIGKIDGVEETSFTVINFSANGFTLLVKDESQKRQKIYNYFIKF